MLGLGTGLSAAGVFVSLMAIMIVFMGHEGVVVPTLLASLLLGVPVTAVLAVITMRYWPGTGVAHALRACPAWVCVMCGVLVAVLGIALLALVLARLASGEPVPARFHLPVVALAWYAGSLTLFAGLLARRGERARTTGG